jgi:hypothetical protein
MDEKHDMTFFYANVFHNLKWIEKKEPKGHGRLSIVALLKIIIRYAIQNSS